MRQWRHAGDTSNLYVLRGVGGCELQFKRRPVTPKLPEILPTYFVTSFQAYNRVHSIPHWSSATNFNPGLKHLVIQQTPRGSESHFSPSQLEMSPFPAPTRTFKPFTPPVSSMPTSRPRPASTYSPPISRQVSLSSNSSGIGTNLNSRETFSSTQKPLER